MIVLFLVNMVISWIIVTLGQKIYMKIIGANVVFFNGKNKIMWMVVISGILLACGI